jgi:O-antigen/teichoic acid export membrane protein
MRNLLKAMLTTGGATLVSQVLGLIANKILAVSIGTAGIGFYSMMRQAHDTAVGLGAIGAGGLVQGLAGRPQPARTRLWRAAIVLTAVAAVIAAIAIVAFNRPIARLLFDRDDDIAVLAVSLCAATVALGVIWLTLGAAINAARAIGALAGLGLAGAAIGALLAWPVARLAEAQAASLALLIGVPLLLQIAGAVFLVRRSTFLTEAASRQARPGRPEFAYFAQFFAFNSVLGVAGAVALLFVRSALVHAEGLAAAGLLAAAWGLGMQSMALVFSAFGTYVLPGLAAEDADGRRKLLQDSATLVLALVLPLLVALVAWKPLVLRLLFSAEFLPAVALLQWLLIGNYLKALAWVFAVPLLATADLPRYLAIELTWYAVFAGGSAVALAQGQPFLGIGLAFVAAYGIYLLLAAWLAWRRFGFRLSTRSTASFAAGIAMLAATAGLTWNAQSIDWPVALGAPLLAMVPAFLALTPHHRTRGWAMLRQRLGK